MGLSPSIVATAMMHGLTTKTDNHGQVVIEEADLRAHTWHRTGYPKPETLLDGEKSHTSLVERFKLHNIRQGLSNDGIAARLNELMPSEEMHLKGYQVCYWHEANDIPTKYDECVRKYLGEVKESVVFEEVHTLPTTEGMQWIPEPSLAPSWRDELAARILCAWATDIGACGNASSNINASFRVAEKFIRYSKEHPPC
jgi:hypothetical protein